MARKHMTMRGDAFDMNKLRSANGHQPALGNAGKNARGDMINSKGVVLKTQEQINAEWEANRRANEEAVRVVSIKDDLSKVVPETKKPVKQLLVDDQGFDPAPVVEPTHTKTKRKITDAE